MQLSKLKDFFSNLLSLVRSKPRDGVVYSKSFTSYHLPRTPRDIISKLEVIELTKCGYAYMEFDYCDGVVVGCRKCFRGGIVDMNVDYCRSCKHQVMQYETEKNQLGVVYKCPNCRIPMIEVKIDIAD